MRSQDRIDRFFLGRINERARVYDQNVGLVGGRRNFHAALQHASEHELGVHQIFGAAKTDHADFCAHQDELNRFALFDGDVVVAVCDRFTVFLDLNCVAIQNPDRDFLSAEFDGSVCR